MGAIVRVAFAVSEEAASSATAQSRQQIIEPDAHDPRSLNEIHNRAQTLAHRHVGESEGLMNPRFRRGQVAHAVVLKTHDSVSQLMQASECFLRLHRASFSLESKWQRR